MKATQLVLKFLAAFILLYSSMTHAMEAPEGIVYCHGKTVVEFVFDRYVNCGGKITIIEDK